MSLMTLIYSSKVLLMRNPTQNILLNCQIKKTFCQTENVISSAPQYFSKQTSNRTTDLRSTDQKDKLRWVLDKLR